MNECPATPPLVQDECSDDGWEIAPRVATSNEVDVLDFEDRDGCHS